MSDISSLPGTINLDLDEAERDPGDVKAPFAVNVGGRRILFNDPEDVDWQDLFEVETPYDMLRIGTSQDDRRHILGLNLPGWKFKKLIDAYNQHYGIDDKVAEARRKQLRSL